MKILKKYLEKQYSGSYYTGSIYDGGETIVYFPFTPGSLKAQKLKIAIVYNYKADRFEIWLAGQNKQIQKKYHELFKGSDWNKYHILDDISDGFSICDSVLIENPDLNKSDALIACIETRAIEFIREMEEVLGQE